MKQQEKEKEYETYVKEKTPVSTTLARIRISEHQLAEISFDIPAFSHAFKIVCPIVQMIPPVTNAFAIAGPGFLYGVFTSWVLGLLYWIGTLIGIV